MKDKINSFRDLKVWQIAKLMVKEVYWITRVFPKEEMYGLTQQIRRAAVSNIAEGHARASRKEFLQFLSIALGSLAELETQLELAADLEYIKEQDKENLLSKLDRLGKMMRTLIHSLKNPASSLQPPAPSMQTSSVGGESW